MPVSSTLCGKDCVGQFTELSFLLICVLDIQGGNLSLYQGIMQDLPNSEVSFKIYLELVSKT